MVKCLKLLIRLTSIIGLMFFATGCSNTDIDTYYDTPTPTATIAPTPTSTPAPTPEPSNPQNIEILYNKIVEVGKENNLSYCIDDAPKYNITAYKFSLALSENPSANGKAIFCMDKDKKSFEIHFSESTYGNVAPPLITDALKATLLYIDSSLTLTDAENIIIDLCGDYRIHVL